MTEMILTAFGLLALAGLAALGVILALRQRQLEQSPSSEGVYRLALDAAQDAIILARRDGVIELANRRAERMFRYEHGRMDGLHVEALIPARFRKRHAAHYERWFDEPSSRSLGHGDESFYALRADGTEFMVRIGLAPAAEGTRAVAVIKEVLP